MTRGITIEELQKEKESIEKDTVTISESCFILYNTLTLFSDIIYFSKRY